MAKFIVYLDDFPEEEVLDLISQTYQLICVTSLRSFHEQVQSFQGNEDQILGFIIDGMIPAENLEDVGMPEVYVDGGCTTGVMIIREYLRGGSARRTQASTSSEFQNTPILFMSVAAPHYSAFDELDNIEIVRKYLPMGSDSWLQSVQEWLYRLD